MEHNPILTLYGDVQLVRAWCNICETYAIVKDGRLTCCDSIATGVLLEQSRMSTSIDRYDENRVKTHFKSDRDKRLKENGGSHTKKEWKDLCDRYGNICLACGEPEILTEDHVMPVSRGGTDYISNIQPLCQSCNSKKSTNATDYRQRFQ
jgi:5-methylcytosine-specific restriction endonuclease McrA